MMGLCPDPVSVPALSDWAPALHWLLNAILSVTTEDINQ